MKIEEAKEKLHWLAFKDLNTKPDSLRLQDVFEIINQIELDQPKPEVPQMIFDVIKKFKGENRSFYSLLENISAVKEAWEWLNMPKPGIKESELMKAWLAYPNITVEKEKLYTVEIPNPHAKGHNKIYLCKADNTGKVYLCKGNFNPKKNKNLRLTEQEIRKDFDWAWQWKKEVTE